MYLWRTCKLLVINIVIISFVKCWVCSEQSKVAAWEKDGCNKTTQVWIYHSLCYKYSTSVQCTFIRMSSIACTMTGRLPCRLNSWEVRRGASFLPRLTTCKHLFPKFRRGNFYARMLRIDKNSIQSETSPIWSKLKIHAIAKPIPENSRKADRMTWK